LKGHSILDAIWKKSSKCGTNACVEVKITNHAVAVRDNAEGLVIYTHDEWQSFIDGVKAGEFDL
jgi:uncharacterized protein DUF397